MKKKSLAKKVVCIVLCAVLMIGTVVADALCFQPNVAHTITAFLGGGLAVTDQAEKAASYENAAAAAKEISQEGIVLLKNENNALPLSGVTKVNLFGYASAHPYVSGTGSGGVDGGTSVSLKEGLSGAGIEVNEALYEKYQDYAGSDAAADAVTEPAIDDAAFYSTDLWQSYQDYSDTAILVLGRKGGEGADLLHGYLTISQNERDLLTELESRFGTVIVLINTGNAMELGFLDEAGVDAALLIHYTGNNGALAVAEALTGAVNPSGKTVDTYAYSHADNPSYLSSGIEATRAYTGMEPNAQTGKGWYYIDYTEGIYVGYRYYETRWVDNATGAVDEAAYSAAVQYPFGYGLSYTTFDQEIISHDGALTDNGADHLTVTVKVTNTGAVAGKDVVQLYATPPYTVGGIEKSAVNLVAYGKTNLLQPGESQELTLTFQVQDLASYDYSDANRDGHKGYELEAGSYVLSLRTDAHTAVDAFDLTLAVTKHYDVDEVTGAAIQNRFDDCGGADETESVVYLSRADWEGTWNKGDGRKDTYVDYSAAEGMTSYTIRYTDGRSASEAVLNSTNEYLEAHYADGDDASVSMPTTGAKNGLTIADMKGLAYDDPQWDKLLDQMTVADLQTFVGSGAMGIGAMESIGFAQSASNDGPAGIAAAYAYNGGTSTDACYAYPNEVCVASSWNNDLAYRFGAAVGREAHACHVTMWYAPAMNTHRTPYGGRNYEYFSEDGLLGGYMGASVVQGCKDEGLTAMVKHFALNEQETARNVDGLYTWCTEQAMREIYFKPFEKTVKNSDCRAIMTSFNRLGATWAGNSAALLNETLRGEWGFQGVCETDAYVPMPGGDATYYMTMNSGIRAGNDIWLQGFGTDVPSTAANEAYTVSVMRQNVKNVLYSVADGDFVAEDTSMPGWQIALIAGSVVIYAGCLAALYFTFLHKKKAKIEVESASKQ